MRDRERAIGRNGLLALRVERKVKPLSGSRPSRPKLRLAALAAALALLLLLPAASNAAVRSVTQSGSDAGNCTLSPCRTINYGVSQASPGDTVTVGSGTFVETRVTITKPLT